MLRLCYSDEVSGLKDDLGGGNVLDDSEGYTRSSNNKDVNYQEKEDSLDAAVEASD